MRHDVMNVSLCVFMYICMYVYIYTHTYEV